MADALQDWHPDDQELEAILAELRPIMRQLAGRGLPGPDEGASDALPG